MNGGKIVRNESSWMERNVMELHGTRLVSTAAHHITVIAVWDGMGNSASWLSCWEIISTRRESGLEHELSSEDRLHKAQIRYIRNVLKNHSKLVLGTKIRIGAHFMVRSLDLTTKVSSGIQYTVYRTVHLLCLKLYLLILPIVSKLSWHTRARPCMRSTPLARQGFG